MMFGNRTVALHLLRGALGFGALALAVGGSVSPWAALALIPVALIALKGCPVCWTMGLIETLAMRIHARHGETAGSGHAISHTQEPPDLPSRGQFAVRPRIAT